MRNHEVKAAGLLLDETGELREPGWSRSQVQKYRRAMIKAPKFRIKEWDYYLVTNDKFAAAFTVSDDGYIGLQSVSLLVFGDEPWEHTETVLNAFPMGRLRLPEDSSFGTTKYEDARLQMRFEAKYQKRHIIYKHDMSVTVGYERCRKLKHECHDKCCVFAELAVFGTARVGDPG